MDTQETVLVSKVPILKPNEFDMWKIRIRQYMLLIDYRIWEVVENEPGTDEEVAEGAPRPPPRSDADRKRRQTEMKALSTLLLAIANEYQHQFSSCTDAKALWTTLEKRFSGTKSTKRNQKAILKQQYENFTSLKNESMTQSFDRFNKLIGELATVDVKMDKDDVFRIGKRELNFQFKFSESEIVLYYESENIVLRIGEQASDLGSCSLKISFSESNLLFSEFSLFRIGKYHFPNRKTCFSASTNFEPNTIRKTSVSRSDFASSSRNSCKIVPRIRHLASFQNLLNLEAICVPRRSKYLFLKTFSF
ncbi:hypothetical protein OSB04_025333 [Centaurea solstitialis]|uniref:Uncharacterized protein n=1 Tax=Centaurea solstitialis TaxID=347529 RepID=A0AA38T1A2_9ASTR|nr:hypothetical protein OSB04_025333 [Centaurea solstitialis]